MLFDGGFTFANFITDAFAIFLFIIWFWLLITVCGDLFRRSDVSGFGKVLWIVLFLFVPYIGVFAYLLTQGHGIAQRQEERSRAMRDDLRNAIGFSVADEIEKLNRLKAAGSISETEYAQLRGRLVG